VTSVARSLRKWRNYIPSNSEHGIRNIGNDLLKFVYVYLIDSIQDVEYIWSGR
jgi:oxalate decarboxylase/phosphoglucose isomerase-like protein (cupin superfamily)